MTRHPAAPPRPLALVVLDFDGVLVDTERIAVHTARDLLDDEGLRLPHGLPVRTDGTLDRTALPAELTRLTGPDRTRHLWEEFERRNRDRADQADLMPGALPFLDHCRTRGHHLAIASGNTRDWVEGHLHRLGLRERFTTVSCAGAGTKAKPEPDTYLNVLRTTRQDPSRVLAVEDSYSGLAAAHAAGLPVVWATTAPARASAPVPVVRRVRSLRELTTSPTQAPCDTPSP